MAVPSVWSVRRSVLNMNRNFLGGSEKFAFPVHIVISSQIAMWRRHQVARVNFFLGKTHTQKTNNRATRIHDFGGSRESLTSCFYRWSSSSNGACFRSRCRRKVRPAPCAPLFNCMLFVDAAPSKMRHSFAAQVEPPSTDGQPLRRLGGTPATQQKELVGHSLRHVLNATQPTGAAASTASRGCFVNRLASYPWHSRVQMTLE